MAAILVPRDRAWEVWDYKIKIWNPHKICRKFEHTCDILIASLEVQIMWTFLLHTICKHFFTKMAARGHMHLPKCHMQPFHTWGSDSDGLSQFWKGAGSSTDKFPRCCHCLPSENLPRPLIVSGSPDDAIWTTEREEDDYLWSWLLFTAGSIHDIRKTVKLNPQKKILRPELGFQGGNLGI